MKTKKLAALALGVLFVFCSASCTPDGGFSSEAEDKTSVISADGSIVDSPISSLSESSVEEEQSALSESETYSTEEEQSALSDSELYSAEDSSSAQEAETDDSSADPGVEDEPEPITPPEFLTALPIPSAYVAPNSDQHGTVETIVYQTKIYDLNGNGSETVEKRADVYLPYGYNPKARKRYNVLYLMHGGGETYTYWLTENKNTVNMLDNLFASGKAEPCIVVAPTFYTGSASGTSATPTDVFQWEFRNDLVPAVEAAYNTYARTNVSLEGLIATREHRGFAGLSMGSMVSIRSIVIGCLDICAYVNSMSGGYDANETNTQTGFNLIKEAITVKFKDYPVKYWLNHNGNNDMALSPHQSLNGMILSDGDLSSLLVEDVNYKWIKFPTGSHSYDSWIAGTYNCLLVFFK